ncbi:chemotaxis protein CheW [Planctomycetota bacterium]|nr:chemotaxis protein CheW [Planctomycetota bacterium]
MPPLAHTAAAVRARTTRSAADKYLAFTLAAERFAIPILKIQEIIGLLDITPVPRMPDWLRGVINLRGRVIPVIDLRLKLGLPRGIDGKRSCIVVVQMTATASSATAGQTLILGAVVDLVNEVQNIPATDIEPAPAMGTGIDSACIVGMGKVGGKVVVLLDIEKALSTADLGAAQAASG